MELYCPLCDSYAKSFRGFGRPKRKNAQCYECRSLERHRLAWTYLQRKTSFFECKGNNILHVAPEPQMESRFRTVPGVNYLSADLEEGRAMVQMDLTDIQFSDAHFDVIFCSHVLEHIPDDRKAMREMARVLRYDGVVFIQVPLAEDPTYEDFSITSTKGRLKAFGQEDHVRIYGPDILDRLIESGFDAEIVKARSFLSAEEVSAMVIGKRSIIVARRSDKPMTKEIS